MIILFLDLGGFMRRQKLTNKVKLNLGKRYRNNNYREDNKDKWSGLTDES